MNGLCDPFVDIRIALSAELQLSQTRWASSPLSTPAGNVAQFSHRLQAAFERPAEHPHQVFLHAFLVQAATIPPALCTMGVPGKNACHRVKRKQPSLFQNTGGNGRARSLQLQKKMEQLFGEAEP